MGLNGIGTLEFEGQHDGDILELSKVGCPPPSFLFVLLTQGTPMITIAVVGKQVDLRWLCRKANATLGFAPAWRKPTIGCHFSPGGNDIHWRHHQRSLSHHWLNPVGNIGDNVGVDTEDHCRRPKDEITLYIIIIQSLHDIRGFSDSQTNQKHHLVGFNIIL